MEPAAHGWLGHAKKRGVGGQICNDKQGTFSYFFSKLCLTSSESDKQIEQTKLVK